MHEVLPELLMVTNTPDVFGDDVADVAALSIVGASRARAGDAARVVREQGDDVALPLARGAGHPSGEAR